MGERQVTVAAIMIAATVSFAGCSPAPTVSPTSTPLSTEELAFAEAEATYRAYIAALNRVDLSDPSTFRPLFDLTVGAAREAAESQFTAMHEEGWTVAGQTEVTLVQRADGRRDDGDIVLLVCVDVSDVTMIDKSSRSVVSPDRQDLQPMRVVLESAADRGWAISQFAGRDGEPSCERG